MSRSVARLIGVPAVVLVVWAALAALTPLAMREYAPYSPRAGISCGPVVRLVQGVPVVDAARCANGLADAYRTQFADLVVDATLRSLALLAGAALLALVLGVLLGVAIALLRRRALASGVAMGLTSLLAAVPSFFVAYFLQIAVIVAGSSAQGARLLPVYGFGYDGHLVLPLVAIALPAITYTAQLTAARMHEVLDSDFVVTANAKGLATSWIVGVHVLPHVRPMALEALGSGLRISVASLPIVEYLFNWRGIGQLAVEAVAVHDPRVFVFSAVVLAAFFATLAAVADLSRPRALYR